MIARDPKATAKTIFVALDDSGTLNADGMTFSVLFKACVWDLALSRVEVAIALMLGRARTQFGYEFSRDQRRTQC